MLDKLAMFQNHDAVGVPDRAEAMGHHDRGAVPRDALDGVTAAIDGAKALLCGTSRAVTRVHLIDGITRG